MRVRAQRTKNGPLEFIAGLAGPVFLALGVSMLVNRDMFPEVVHQLQNNFALIIVAGGIVLVAGLAILKTHNIWTGWPAIITLLGWLLVTGGALRIVLPRQMAEVAASMGPSPAFLTLAAAVLCVAGAFLTYKGNT